MRYIMIYKKKCIVCGKEFEATQVNYSLCSDECRKKRKNETDNRYKTSHIDEIKKRKREHQRDNAKVIVCSLCGEPVAPEIGGGDRVLRKHYHEECVIEDAIKAIKFGAKSKDSRVKRAYNLYGWGIKDLKMMDNEM